MSIDPNKPSGDNDRLESVLIGDALDAPPVDASFSADLERRLAADFSGQHAQPSAPPDTLGMLLNAKQLATADYQEDEEHRRRVAQARREMRRLSGEPTKRLSLNRKLALAASLAALLVASVWSRPAYTWSRTVESLRNQPWVRVVEVVDNDRPAVWLSTRQGEPPLWREGRPVVVTVDQMSNSRLRPGENRVTDTLLNKKRSAQEVQAQLYSLLVNGTTVSNADLVKEVRLTHSQARPVDQGVELDITLAVADRQVRARFLVDADSHLPLACEVIRPLDATRNDIPALRLAFEYPSKGPERLAQQPSNVLPEGTLLAAALAGL